MSNIFRKLRLFFGRFILAMISLFALNLNFNVVNAALIDDVLRQDIVFYRNGQGKVEGHFEYLKFLPGGEGVFYGLNANSISSQPIDEEIIFLDDAEPIVVPVYKDPDPYVLNFSWIKNKDNTNQVFINFENKIGYAVNLVKEGSFISLEIVGVIHKIKNTNLKIVFPPIYKRFRATESKEFYSGGSLHSGTPLKLKEWEGKKTKEKLLVPDYRYALA